MSTGQNIILHLGTLCYLGSLVGSILFIRTPRPSRMALARVLALTGSLFHLILLGLLGIQGRYFPITTAMETLLSIATLLVWLTLFLDTTLNLPLLTALTTPLFTSLALIAVFFSTRLDSPQNAQNFWTGFHTAITIAGIALLAVACVTGILYLLEDHALKKKTASPLFNIFPSLESIYQINTRTLACGFSLVTVGIIIGYLYARSIHSDNTWRLDPKILISTLTWFVYLFSLMVRALPRWKGRQAVFLSVISFAFVILTFCAGFFWKGFHSIP